MINLRHFLGLNYYISNIDAFLNKIRRKSTHLSKAQQKEINKYQSIHHKRQCASPKTSPLNHKLWEKF